MHQREAGLRLLDPARVPARQIGGGIIGRAKQTEAVLRQWRDHHRRGRTIVDLLSGGTDTETDAADPGIDAGPGGEIAHQPRQCRRGRFADIKNAERCVSSRAGELRQATLSQGVDIANGQSGGKGRRHQEPPISRAI